MQPGLTLSGDEWLGFTPIELSNIGPDRSTTTVDLKSTLGSVRCRWHPRPRQESGLSSMGKIYESIDDHLSEWIRARELLFVATAPLAGDGLVNCSPKGLDTFRIIDPLTVAYADLTGSGIETAAHLRENGRIVVMFCAFDGPPKIVRLHGKGEYLVPTSRQFQLLSPEFNQERGIRGITKISVARISDSCGYGVPNYKFLGQREPLTQWAVRKSDEELAEYVRQNNSQSLDGLPGI